MKSIKTKFQLYSVFIIVISVLLSIIGSSLYFYYCQQKNDFARLKAAVGAVEGQFQKELESRNKRISLILKQMPRINEIVNIFFSDYSSTKLSNELTYSPELSTTLFQSHGIFDVDSWAILTKDADHFISFENENGMVNIDNSIAMKMNDLGILEEHAVKSAGKTKWFTGLQPGLNGCGKDICWVFNTELDHAKNIVFVGMKRLGLSSTLLKNALGVELFFFDSGFSPIQGSLDFSVDVEKEKDLSTSQLSLRRRFSQKGDSYESIVARILPSHLATETTPRVLVGLPSSETVQSITNSILMLVGMGLSVVFAFAVISGVLSKKFTEPLLALAKSTHILSLGDYSVRVGLPKAQDEIFELSSSFNSMASQIEISRKAIDLQIKNIEFLGKLSRELLG